MDIKIMESGNFLEEQVQKFCKERQKDEGEIWKRINTNYLDISNPKKDLMWEKNKFEEENNFKNDIPMAQWIAKCELVHEIMPILDEIINTMI